MNSKAQIILEDFMGNFLDYIEMSDFYYRFNVNTV